MRFILITILTSILLSSCCTDKGAMEEPDAVASTFLPYQEGDTIQMISSSGNSDSLFVTSIVNGQDREKTKGQCCCNVYSTKDQNLKLGSIAKSIISLGIGQYEGFRIRVTYNNSSYSEKTYDRSYFGNGADNSFLQELKVGSVTYKDVARFNPNAGKSPEIKTVFVAANYGVIQVITQFNDTILIKD